MVILHPRQKTPRSRSAILRRREMPHRLRLLARLLWPEGLTGLGHMTPPDDSLLAGIHGLAFSLYLRSLFVTFG